MTDFETLTLFISCLALIISIYVFTQQRKLQKEANDLQRPTSKLSEQMLEKLKHEANEQRHAKLSLTLEGKQWAHVLVLRNIGLVPATNVRIESIGQPSLLISHQIESMFPLGQVKPDSTVELGVAIYMESPPKFGVRLMWTDPDGAERMDEFEIVH
jgi:hypothetical protein